MSKYKILPNGSPDLTPAECAGDKKLFNKIARKRCNEIHHVEFADVEIAEMISKLENELTEFYDMEAEHQKKLAEAHTINMLNDINILDCHDLENVNGTTTKMLPEPPPTKTDTRCGTVMKVRGCAISEGDRNVLTNEHRGSHLNYNRK